MKNKLYLGLTIFISSLYLNYLSVCASGYQFPSAGITAVFASIDVTEPAEDVQVYEVPENPGFKSYMSYELFSKKTKQFTLQNLCTTDSDGFRRVNDNYVIALGTHFDASVGQRVDLLLQNGVVIQCVIGDVKQNCHTDKSNIFSLGNECMSEFVVDIDELNRKVKRTGDVSYLPSQDWNSPVMSVWVLNENVLEDQPYQNNEGSYDDRS